MKSKFFRVLNLIILLFSVLIISSACTEEIHEHVFYKKLVEDKYLVHQPTCTERAKYYYSCDCGEHGDQTFAVGEALGHNYVDYVCSYCNIEECSRGLDFKYNVETNTYAIIGMGKCTDTNVIIPLTYNDKPVTIIADNAFYHKPITSVVIKDNVTTIGNNAFRGCNKLESITFTDSLKHIGNYAFRGCNALTQIIIPSNVTTVMSNVFFNCNHLLEIYCEISEEEIPKGWKSDWNLMYEDKYYTPIWNYDKN